MSDRIQDFLGGLAEDKQRQLIEKLQRTSVRFRNGSRIIALPNSARVYGAVQSPLPGRGVAFVPH